MPEPTDQTDEPEWVQQLRAAGRKFRRGTDRSELPFEPGVDFRPPASAEQECHAEHAQADLPVEPDWVHRLRAKGYKVTTGTVGPPGLSDDEYPGFRPPELPHRSVRERLASFAGRLFTRLVRHHGRSHGTVP